MAWLEEFNVIRIRHVQTRFIIAGCLLVLTTACSGLWSAMTFARLTRVVDRTIRESQGTVELTASLAESLEKEDDALLRALSRSFTVENDDLKSSREKGDRILKELLRHLQNGTEDEQELAALLPKEIEAYRDASTALLHGGDPRKALESYHESVNPLLRQAVKACGHAREINYREMQDSGVRARDEAERATRLVTAMLVTAIALGTLVSLWLARSIVAPIRELTRSVDAVRQGNFEQRLSLEQADEIGVLAEGFNRMMETLAEYRRSSLGELLAAKSTLEATINALPDAVFVITPERTIETLNDQAKMFLGDLALSGLEIEQLPFYATYRTVLENALLGQSFSPSPTNFQGAYTFMIAGVTRQYNLTLVSIPAYDCRRFGLVAVLNDITEFARLDALRSELIGMASHELKTPLTTLRMNLLLLLERSQNLNDRQKICLEAANQGCEELGETIEELLDVTRVEAGQLRLHLIPIQARALIGTIVKKLQPRFDDAQVRILMPAVEQEQILLADASRLAIVITNLLTNALKYSRPGGTITCEVVSRQNAACGTPAFVQIAVTDEGIGVPEAYRDKIFEKFFRVEHYRESESAGARGTGIGLYLCREIIKAHQGTIECQPGVHGRGARFLIQLPAPSFADN